MSSSKEDEAQHVEYSRPHLDPVEALFASLPTPEQYHYMNFSPDRSKNSTKSAFKDLANAEKSQSTDVDFDLISRYASKVVAGQPIYLFLNQIAHLANSRPISDGDGSAKARLFRYLKWASLGRKDEHSPFAPAVAAAASPHADDAVSHAFLPQEDASCARCGAAGARVACERCAVVGLTSYCSVLCRAAHSNAHAAECRGRWELRERASLLQRLLRIYYGEAYTEMLVSAAEEDEEDEGGRGGRGHRRLNIIEYRFRDADAHRAVPYFQDFPRRLCGSDEHAEAVMFHLRCADVAAIHRFLVELILRPVCEKIENVVFCPKNIERTNQMRTQTDGGGGGWYDYNSLRAHQVLRLTLRGPQQEPGVTMTTMALDVSAGQYGWREHLAPWATYARHRVHRQLGVLELGPLGDGTMIRSTRIYIRRGKLEIETGTETEMGPWSREERVQFPSPSSFRRMQTQTPSQMASASASSGSGPGPGYCQIFCDADAASLAARFLAARLLAEALLEAGPLGKADAVEGGGGEVAGTRPADDDVLGHVFSRSYGRRRPRDEVSVVLDELVRAVRAAFREKMARLSRERSGLVRHVARPGDGRLTVASVLGEAL